GGPGRLRRARDRAQGHPPGPGTGARFGAAGVRQCDGRSLGVQQRHDESVDVPVIGRSAWYYPETGGYTQEAAGRSRWWANPRPISRATRSTRRALISAPARRGAQGASAKGPDRAAAAATRNASLTFVLGSVHPQ